MNCVSVTELGTKEVVNLCDGTRYGCVSDVEVCIEDARITAIVVPKTRNLLKLLCRREHYVIPWECINRIGPDIILVDYRTKTPRAKKKHKWI